MNLKELVKTTQKTVDQMIPGKVVITVDKCPETKRNYLCGAYDTVAGTIHVHTEPIDRFFTDATLFLMFFKQRIKYMNASKEAQLAFNGHPAMF